MAFDFEQVVELGKGGQSQSFALAPRRRAARDPPKADGLWKPII